MNKELDARLLQLELDYQSQKRDLEELKTFVIRISVMVNDIQTQINNLIDVENGL